jgi:hypothetical protein
MVNGPGVFSWIQMSAVSAGERQRSAHHHDLTLIAMPEKSSRSPKKPGGGHPNRKPPQPEEDSEPESEPKPRKDKGKAKSIPQDDAESEPAQQPSTGLESSWVPRPINIRQQANTGTSTSPGRLQAAKKLRRHDRMPPSAAEMAQAWEDDEQAAEEAARLEAERAEAEKQEAARKAKAKRRKAMLERGPLVVQNPDAAEGDGGQDGGEGGRLRAGRRCRLMQNRQEDDEVDSA